MFKVSNVWKICLRGIKKEVVSKYPFLIIVSSITCQKWTFATIFKISQFQTWPKLFQSRGRNSEDRISWTKKCSFILSSCFSFFNFFFFNERLICQERFQKSAILNELFFQAINQVGGVYYESKFAFFRVIPVLEKRVMLYIGFQEVKSVFSIKQGSF